MTGATFTVSTLGAYGIREFSAIINPPEVGILAIGAAERRPVVKDDQIAGVLTATSDPQRCAQVLVNQALENQSKDNITSMVIHVI